MKTKQEAEVFLKEILTECLIMYNTKWTVERLNARFKGLGDLYIFHVTKPSSTFSPDKFHEEAITLILTSNTKLFKALK